MIDAATRTNLELLRTMSGNKKGSLFHAVNRTMTGAGARLLTDQMMSPLTDSAMVNLRLDAVEWFCTEGLLRESLRTLFKSVPDFARALSRVSLNRGGPRDLAVIDQALECARDTGALFAQYRNFPQELDRVLSTLSSLPDTLHDHLRATLNDSLPLLARDGGFVRPGYSPELDELCHLRNESQQIIAKLQRDYAAKTGVKNLKIRHNNVLGYFIEVTANNAQALNNEKERHFFIHRQTLASVMRFTTTELADLETKIANAGGRAIEVELAIFADLVSETIAAGPMLCAIADALALLDVQTSLAHLADEKAYTRPLVDDSLAFDIKQGRHPSVEQMLQAGSAQPFIANDCSIGPGKEQGGHKALVGHIWLITGPNMGGKSTFLRQCD